VAYRRHQGGRQAKLTKTQKQQLCKLIDAGPEAAGFETACWNSVLIQTVDQARVRRGVQSLLRVRIAAQPGLLVPEKRGLCPIIWTKRVGKRGGLKNGRRF